MCEKYKTEYKKMKEGLKTNSILVWIRWYLRQLISVLYVLIIKSCVKTLTNFKQGSRRFSVKNLQAGSSNSTK